VTSRLLALLAPACLFALVAPSFADEPMPKVPDGFKCEIVLQAPDIEAPTALCVAPNGDVYFAEDPMDMSGPPTKNIDRIWLLKGGDPHKKILFAENMWAVMGLELVGDKLYCVNAPHVTVFTLDAEGKAASQKDLFTDLGPPVAGVPSFNDHIPSGIRMGADGWLYVSIGDKGIPKMPRKEANAGSAYVTEGRERRTKEGQTISLEGGGVIRFRPDGSGLEVFCSGTRNHLDVPLDDHDRIFVRDNTDDGRGWWARLMYLPPGGFMGYPWAYTRRPEETLPIIHDFGGGAPCGGYVYNDDGLPETYRGRIFHCEWGQGKVWAVKVAPDGAGFKYVDQIAFMDPDKVKDFRPFSIRPTADGRGFYVTDWGFSGWLQNKKAGRIYKVTYVKDDVKPAPRGSDKDSIADLIKALGHPAYTERLRAQRALQGRRYEAWVAFTKTLEDPKSIPPGAWARADEVSVALTKALKDGKLSARARERTVWILRGYLSQIKELLNDSDAGVRLEAVRALTPDNRNGVFDLGIKQLVDFELAIQERLVGDPDPQVRLHAAMALSTIPFAEEQIPWQQLRQEKDPFVRFALVRTFKRAVHWDQVVYLMDQAEWAKGKAAMDGLLWALADEYDTNAVAVLTKLAKHDDPAVRQKAVAELARVYRDRKPYAGGWWGTQPAAHDPPPREVDWEGTPAVREAVLAALADKDPAVRKAASLGLAAVNDPATLEPLEKQFASEKDVEARTDLLRAVAGLASPKAADFLTGIVKDGKEAQSLRIEAVAGLEKLKTPASAETLAALAAPSEPVALQVRALAALGALKLPAGKDASIKALKSDDPSVRAAAATATAQTAGADAVALLTPLLEDKDTAVRIAAVQGLGSLKNKAAVPALLRAAGDEATEFDAITALAQTPDAHALPAYLIGLGSKNADLRKACKTALAAVRDEAAPSLEQLVKGNEVKQDLLPDLRSIYSAHVPILEWRLIGPFPRDGKVYPPETEQKFDAVYTSFDKQVKWMKRKADAKQHGRMNLDRQFTPNNDVVAYGYAEVESATDRNAELLVGSDDTIAIWVNGKKVHETQGDRGWNYEQDHVQVHLDKGVNKVLIRCGNSAGPWEFSVAVSGEAEQYAFLKGGTKKFNLEEFRAFARKTPGDPGRGEKLFRDLKGLACIKCHAVGGQGGQVGPDLAGIAVKYKREDLMTSVLEPSKVIAQGYETILINTDKGITLTGVFKGETADAVNLADKDGKLVAIPKKEIDERKFSPVSTMPNGLNDGMTLQDFADVVAFLEARKEEKTPPKK
jgi:putative membrane-bound dehydrogenase-like protein